MRCGRARPRPARAEREPPPAAARRHRRGLAPTGARRGSPRRKPSTPPRSCADGTNIKFASNTARVEPVSAGVPCGYRSGALQTANMGIGLRRRSRDPTPVSTRPALTEAGTLRIGSRGTPWQDRRARRLLHSRPCDRWPSRRWRQRGRHNDGRHDNSCFDDRACGHDAGSDDGDGRHYHDGRAHNNRGDGADDDASRPTTAERRCGYGCCLRSSQSLWRRR